MRRLQHLVELGELLGPAGERVHPGGQQRGDRGSGARRLRVVVAGEQPLVQLAQLPPRVHAELVGEPGPDRVVGGERVRLAAAAEQRQHELPGHALVERPRRGVAGEHGDQLGMFPGAQPQVGVLQLGGHPLGFQLVAQRVRPGAVHARERLAAPQAQRLLEERPRVFAGRSGLGTQRAEPVQVHRAAVDREHVPAGPAPDLGAGADGDAQA